MADHQIQVTVRCRLGTSIIPVAVVVTMAAAAAAAVVVAVVVAVAAVFQAEYRTTDS